MLGVLCISLALSTCSLVQGMPISIGTSCRQMQERFGSNIRSGYYCMVEQYQRTDIYCVLRHGEDVWRYSWRVDERCEHRHDRFIRLMSIWTPHSGQPQKTVCHEHGWSRLLFRIPQRTRNIATHSKVCGKIIGYQQKSPDAFGPYNDNPSLTIDDTYVDGISLTHGPSSRKHIWTFAAALDETLNCYLSYKCHACTNIHNPRTIRIPPFVGTTTSVIQLAHSVSR